MSTTVTTLEYQHTDEIKLLPHVPAVSSFHHVTDYESFGNSVSKYDRKSVHISDMPMTWSNWHNHINWPISIIILVLPLVGTVMTYWVPLQRGTALFSIAYCFQTLLGITAGYHRLWSHTSYRATMPLKIYLAAMGAASLQGSIGWWVMKHRAHHRYTDTKKDPYCIHKGLFYAHLGWLLFKRNPKQIGRSDMSDINADPVVVWQHKHYPKCALFMSLILPTILCSLLWNDWKGGLLYAGILRGAIGQQATFCVNSLAHWMGEQPFADRHSPRDNAIVALITLGEGYHNFHHEFPSDYRNAIKWYQYDPTKWAIYIWNRLGLASDLKRFSTNEIQKGHVQQMKKKLKQKESALDWGMPLSKLPIMSWNEFRTEANNGKALVAISGVIYNVLDFVNDHPGGKALVSMAIGKDATAMFNGGVYDHSNAARNMLSTMRYAILRGGGEVEVWKKAPQV